MALSISTKSLTTFLSLNALQCEELAPLITGSLAYKHGSVDQFDCVPEAIKLCEQTLNILKTFQKIPITDELCESNTKMKLSVKPNRMSSLPHDVLFFMCDYLDSFSKARLRFSSMSIHIDMMGCPLDLIQIMDMRKFYTENNPFSPRALVPLLGSCIPFRIIKHQPSNLCSCDASRQLQLIEFRTAEVNQTLCNYLTESQLSLLGIGRSWSITGIKVTGADDEPVDFMKTCETLSKHNAFRSLKRLEFSHVPDINRHLLEALRKYDVSEYVENMFISGGQFESLVDLKYVLPSFKRLRSVNLQSTSIDGSLNGFVKYSPQIEGLELTETNITGNISCLAELKNIKKIRILNIFIKQSLYGDIASLSSCTKLTDLSIGSKDVTGNISSLVTLTKLEILELSNSNVEGKIESLLKYLPKLNYLSLYNNSNLTGELVLTENIELEKIYIMNAHDIHLDLSSLAHLKKFKHCSVGMMSHVKGDISVMSGLTKLRLLKIKDCPEVTGSINSLATLPNLGCLDLISLPKITGDSSLFSDGDFATIRGCDNIEDMTCKIECY